MRYSYKLQITLKNGEIFEAMSEGFGGDFFSVYTGNRINGYRECRNIQYSDCQKVVDVDYNFVMYENGQHHYRNISYDYQSFYDDEYPNH